jgi:hypothetical protein
MAEQVPDLGEMSNRDPVEYDGMVLSPSTTVLRPDATTENPSEHAFVENPRPGHSFHQISQPSEPRLSPQISKSSKSIRLEPPPVVMRPPKVKDQGFGYAALSWLSWIQNTEMDIPDCARSMRRSYHYRRTIRLFGLTLIKDINYKTSESGIDAAVGNFQIVSEA